MGLVFLPYTFDKHAGSPITSCALDIRARTPEIFDDITVVGAIIVQGASIYRFTFLQGERTVVTVKVLL